MSRDFTLITYKKIIQALIENNYKVCSFLEYLNEKNSLSKIAILKHDIDRNPFNALKMAKIEKQMQVNATYYFRILPCSFHTEIIKKISSMRHEVGYHYEDLTLAKGDYDKAIKLFAAHLGKFNEITTIKTISMHGSPLSKWNNKHIWTKYDFKKFGIIGDPSFSIDYEEFVYLTDTGRKWNDEKSNLRDCMQSKLKIRINNSFHLKKLIENNEMPNKIMINIHPQRWIDSYLPWIKELIFQNIKNIGKYLVKKIRKNG
ncbi:MAG: hypothetical protein ACE5KE_00100 [Methanosarcinales archaeon]